MDHPMVAGAHTRGVRVSGLQALPCSPRAGFPSSLRRSGSLRHSRQDCLRDHDNPVTEDLWMHRVRRPFDFEV